MSDQNVDEVLGQKLKDFRRHRARAAEIAKENGGQFGYLPGHPHEFLDATDASVREYFFEVNASIMALHDGGVVSGSKKADDKPKLIEPHICECCTKLVIPIPDDLKRGRPLGSWMPPEPTVGPICGHRKEAIWSTEADLGPGGFGNFGGFRA